MDKNKIFDLSEVPGSVELKTIDDYLKKDIKIMLFFYFCRNCIKIACSLDNPDEFQLNINYKYAFSFDDCKDCRYNLVGFARNYFAIAICYCYQTNKNLVCRHCKQLLYDLNFNTKK